MVWPLKEYLLAAIRGGACDDGLIQRFQMLVYPDVSQDWIDVDRWPDSTAKNRAYSVFQRLANLNHVQLGAEIDSGDPEKIPFLRFSEEAQEIFTERRAKLEHEIRSGELHPAIEAHLAKYRSLIPSLALIDHLVDGESGPVGSNQVRAAIRWGDYLRSHADRIFSVVINPARSASETPRID